MFGNNSSDWKFISLEQLQTLKYCTFYGKKRSSNVTNVLRYIICYDNEICCENGCCPPRPARYYESWCFWIFVCGVMIACYLLCWYCKKLEKERQVARANASSSGNPPRILPCLRPVDSNNVDHLLETLILNYRNRLTSQQPEVQNVDETKISHTEPPPQYTDALKMPKPDIYLEDSSISSDDSMRNHPDDEADAYCVIDLDEQPIPTYEEAIKRI